MDPVSLVVIPIVFPVVTSIINKLISTVGSFIREEVWLVRGVKEELERISSSLTIIQAKLAHADQDERLHKNPDYRNWLAKLENVAYDAEDVLESIATEAALSKRKQQLLLIGTALSVRETHLKYDAAHKIKELKERLDMTAKQGQDFHLGPDIVNSGRSSEQSQTTGTGLSQDTTAVFGRETDKEKIMEMLLSFEENDMSVISIIGMAGLGKTTLAQFIYRDDRLVYKRKKDRVNNDRFDFKIWVTVLAEFDLTRIMREMIKCIISETEMNQLTDLSPSQLQTRLEAILNRKRFILVLDDVWLENYQTWEPLETLLKKGDKGSKVLVTSRITQFADKIGTQPAYFLDFLPEEKCWSLFEEFAFNHRNHSKRLDLEDIGREIVRKCKGLPLAVKAMACLLRGNDDEKFWQKIKSSEIWELEDEDLGSQRPKILPALKISYKHLDSPLRPCFAYCSIFPKAYVFNKEELVKIWIAQGFIHCKKQEKVEDIGNTYFNELLMRSFFQRLNTEKVMYQMHDLIHDLAQSISSPHCCQVKDNNSCSTSRDSRHVSLLCENVEQPILSIVEHSQKLRTLLFPSEYMKNFGQAFEKIFLKLKYLRMLDFSNSTLRELPSSIEELKLLCYLDLSRTEIKELPNAICNLYNLQTLKLLGCLWLFKLPKNIVNLVNLRNLELDEMFWFKCSTLPPSIGNLTSLHNLHSFQVDCKGGYKIEELKSMAYLTGTLHLSKLENAVSAGDAKMNEKKSLDKLVLEWSNRVVNLQDVSDEEKLLEDLQPHSNLKELHIFNYMGDSFPNWITGGLLQNLHTLILKDCTKCKMHSLGHIPHLRVLHIKGMQELEKWTDETCKSVRRLKISCCEKLSVLPKYFPFLEDMKIKKCSSLKTLPVAPYVKFLILVDNPVLEDLNEQDLIIPKSHQGPDEYVPSYEKLLELRISDCPKLQALPKIFGPEKLEISGCKLLETLITIPELRELIKHLALDKCQDGTLVRAIPDTSSLHSLVLSNISNLTSFPRWPNLPGLKALNITCCDDLVSLSGEGSLISLSSLELLSIRGCSKLEGLPNEGLPTSLQCLIIASCFSLKSLGTKGTLKYLNSLKNLYIEDCPLLLSFPEDGLPTSLQHLSIQDCPSLIDQCGTQDGEGPEWPKISHIHDLEIDFISSTHLSQVKPPSAAWYLPFCCRAGFDTSDTRQPEQRTKLNSKAKRQKGRI